eukprot:scaffold68069_cov71-Phaeocystis_antarctica.AAC.3
MSNTKPTRPIEPFWLSNRAAYQTDASYRQRVARCPPHYSPGCMLQTAQAKLQIWVADLPCRNKGVKCAANETYPKRRRSEVACRAHHWHQGASNGLRAPQHLNACDWVPHMTTQSVCGLTWFRFGVFHPS